MKSLRPTTILALALLAASLSDTGRAASIVRNDKWIDRLPQPKELNGGTVKIKRTTDHWVRFEAPAVSRGTLTLSSGTLQFIKGSVLDLATHRAAQFLVEPLTLADVEIAESPMSNMEVASVENGSPGTFTLANTRELLGPVAIFNQLPFEQSTAADLAISDNLGSAVAPNSTAAGASSASETETASAGQGVVPVPEPSVAALSALVVTGMLARRRRR